MRPHETFLLAAQAVEDLPAGVVPIAFAARRGVINPGSVSLHLTPADFQNEMRRRGLGMDDLETNKLTGCHQFSVCDRSGPMPVCLTCEVEYEPAPTDTDRDEALAALEGA